jgi:hypothetical protein
VLVEAGREYGELRGAQIEAEAEIHRDFETVIGFAEELTVRYGRPQALKPYLCTTRT